MLLTAVADDKVCLLVVCNSVKRIYFFHAQSYVDLDFKAGNVIKVHLCRNAKRQGCRADSPTAAAEVTLLSILERENFLSKKIEETEQKIDNKTNTAQSVTNLSEENLQALLKAMKIGFYKDFRKRGLLTDDQLETLIAMQDKSDENKSGAA